MPPSLCPSTTNPASAATTGLRLISTPNARAETVRSALSSRQKLTTDESSATPAPATRVDGRSSAVPPDAAAERFLSLLRAHNVQVTRLSAGEVVPLDDRTTVEVLWPGALPQKADVNDTSLVLKIICDGQSVIVPGDVGAAGQAALGQSASMRADALVLPHHGTWSESLPDFVSAISPRFILASRSRSPAPPVSAGAKAHEFYTHIERPGRFFCTSDRGWIQLRFGAGEAAVTTMR